MGKVLSQIGGTKDMWNCRALLVAALLAALAVGIAACGGGSDTTAGTSTTAAASEEEGSAGKVGFVLPETESQYVLAVKKGAERGAEESGVDLEFAAGKDIADPQETIDAVEAVMTRGVDAMTILATPPDPFTPVLERVGSEVPLIAIDTDLPAVESKAAYIGTNNTKAGETAGEYIKQQFPKGAKVGILTGTPGSTSNDDRLNGFLNAVDGSSIEVVAEERMDCDKEKAVGAMENLLTQAADVEAVFAVCEVLPSTKGAIVRAGRSPKDLLLLGFDASDEELEAISAGTQNATIAQFPEEMGAEAVKQAVQAANGEEIPSVTDTGVEVITKANVKEFLK